jgi:hypothetical protein
MAIDVICDCGKRLKAPDWMAGRSTQCPSCWTAVRIPKRRWLGLRRPAKPRREFNQPRPESKADGFSNVQPGETPPEFDRPTPVTATRPPRRASSVPPVTDPFNAGEPRSGDKSTTFVPKRPATKNRRSTFVPSRAVGDGDDYRPNSIMIRSQPRWVKLISNRGDQQWYQSLLFPFGKLPVFLRLGLLQAVLTTAVLVIWLSMERDNPHQGQFLGCLFVCLCGMLFALGHTFHYFNAILEMACHGKTKHEPGIGCTAIGALVSCGHWLSCFLAGPVLLFAAALGYWIYCGDPTIVDWSILVELCFAAVGWWLIALLLTNLDETLRVASPGQVIGTVLAMPWEFIGVTLLASAVFLGHVLIAAYSIGQLHVTPLVAFPLLWACWSSGLYLTAFTFRRLGLTFYRSQQRVRGRQRKYSRAASTEVLRHQGGLSQENSDVPSTPRQ